MSQDSSICWREEYATKVNSNRVAKESTDPNPRIQKAGVLADRKSTKYLDFLVVFKS